MTDLLQPIRTATSWPQNLPRVGQAAKEENADFGAIFRSAVHSVEQFQKNAENQVEQFLRGENQDLHTTILAAQRAELAFEMFQQVRNKVVQAYQEVMRMQL